MSAVNVFEFRNDTLKESCLVKSRLELEGLRAALERGLERRLAHWDWYGHDIYASDVELALPESAADEFIEEYRRMLGPVPGWRAIDPETAAPPR